MESPERTVRALAEAIIPQDDTIGAADVAAESFVLHYLEFVQPGLSQVLVATLDGLAAGRMGVAFREGTFEELPAYERLAVLRAMGEHQMPDLRDLADLTIVLTIAAFYGEWTGQDDKGRMVSTPVGWELAGYPGPVAAVPSLLKPQVR